MAASWTCAGFQRGAEALCRVFQETECDFKLSKWSLNGSASSGEAHLEHPRVSRGQSAAIASNDDDLFIDDGLVEDTDTVLPSCGSACHKETDWTFSIVYSHTWQQPVLYFFGQESDGSPLTRTRVVDILSNLRHRNKVQDSWDFVSAEEHPVSGMPAFFLHPCRTGALLETINSDPTDDALRLLSWMALIFPSVGYPIPAKLYNQLRQRLQSVSP